ncbi:MAG: hypothetical protein ACR2GB_04815 [Nocardioidaceae bacterium]
MTTTAKTTGISPGASLVRLCVTPTLLAGAISAIAAGASAQLPGIAGAGLGTALVVGFFGFGRAVLTGMRNVDPTYLLVIALLTYGLQVVALLALFAAFQQNPSWLASLSTTALGVTVIVCTLVWTTGLVFAARHERISLYELEGGGS